MSLSAIRYIAEGIKGQVDDLVDDHFWDSIICTYEQSPLGEAKRVYRYESSCEARTFYIRPGSVLASSCTSYIGSTASHE